MYQCLYLLKSNRTIEKNKNYLIFNIRTEMLESMRIIFVPRAFNAFSSCCLIEAQCLGHDCVYNGLLFSLRCCYKKMIYTEHVIRLDTDQHDREHQYWELGNNTQSLPNIPCSIKISEIIRRWKWINWAEFEPQKCGNAWNMKLKVANMSSYHLIR